MRLLFTGLLVFLLIRHGWWKPRQAREKLGPRRFSKPKVPVKLVVFLSVLLVLVGGSEARWQYLHWSASSALKEVTGNPNATLQCQRLSELWIDMDSGSIGGKVSGARVNIATMKYGQCAELFSWMQSWDKSNPSMEQVVAVHVLTHEGIHTTGEFNEAVTECTAIQRDSMMVTKLGADKDTGLLLQKMYFENMYPKMSSAYQLGGCTIDNKFDSLLPSVEDG